MKKLLVLLPLIALASCGKVDRFVAGITGDASKTCIDGVTYLQFTSGATVQVDANGKPVVCK